VWLHNNELKMNTVYSHQITTALLLLPFIYPHEDDRGHRVRTSDATQVFLSIIMIEYPHVMGEIH
jgi:hypothetical protein